MFTDPVAVSVLGVLCLFPLGMVGFFAGSAFLRGGVKFRPVPVIPQRVLFLVLVGLAVYLGWVNANTMFLVLVALSTLALALQHLARKRWIGGRVHGVWFRPLAVRGLEREAGRLVLVLEMGFRLGVPETTENRRFLASLQKWQGPL